MIFLKRFDLKKPTLDHPSRRKELEKRKEILSPVGKQLFKMARKLVEMRRYSVFDALTGLHNRHALKNDLPRLSKIMTREGGYLAAIMIDLDFFKKINDTMGHDAGDSALKHAARIFESCIRAGDKLYRAGGEEFLCLARFPDRNGALALAQRLRTELGKYPCLHRSAHEGTREIKITASVGLCVEEWPIGLTPKEDSYIGAMVNKADKALYEAKQTGRNKCVVADAEKEAPAPQRTNGHRKLSFCTPSQR